MQQELRQNMAGPSQVSKQTQGKQSTVLTTKLTVQAERILKWKMNTEMEVKKRDEKLKEFESTIQKQHSNMLNQQMQCEKLSQRLQTELLNRGELKGKKQGAIKISGTEIGILRAVLLHIQDIKLYFESELLTYIARIDNTREICTILQTYCSQLTTTLQRCIDEKELLKSVYDDQMKDIDELSQKFQNLNEQHHSNVEKLKAVVDEERQGRIKNYNDAKALKVAMEQRLETLGKVLKSEKERAETLSAHLGKSELAIQQISKEKESYREQLEMVKNRLLEVERTLTSEKEQLKQEFNLMQNSLIEEKQRAEKLQHHGDEVLANFHDAVKCKEEGLQDNKKKQQIIDELTVAVETKDEEAGKNLALLESLRDEKQSLEAQVQEFEQLRTEFSQLKISLELTTNEKDMETQQLNIALEELQSLHEAIEKKEKIIKQLEQEHSMSDEQMTRLEKANDELDTKLSQAQVLITSMTADIEQLKTELEAKCGEVEDLRKSLDFLTVSSESEIKEKQKDADDLKSTNTQLETQVEELNGNIKDLQVKYSNLEQEALELRAMLAQEGERGSVSASALMDRSSQLSNLQNLLSAKQEELNAASSLLTRANLEKQQLESRLETSLQEIVKLSSEKNEALSHAACANRDKKLLQDQTEEKLQETLNMYEKYKQDCEDVLQENENKIEKLVQEIEQLKNMNQKSEEKLTLTEKQLDDTLGKMKAIAEKNESKKQRLLEKVAQLEKRLKIKDSELRGLKNHVISISPRTKGHANTLSPRVPSSDLSQAYQPLQTPITGIPVTPKMKSAEPARSILKTPPTTPMTRKRVMFQEESSDTDASAIDILVIDEKEVQRRLEAIKRGDRINNTPLPVVKSPKLTGIMKHRESENPRTPKEASSLPALKRSRYVAEDPPKAKRLFSKVNQAKNKTPQAYENAFGFDD